MGTSARIEELRKKFEENPRRYFAPLANEYRKSGDLEQAIEICRQHLAEQPSHMSGHIVFGQALFEAGQLDEAGQIFAAALALDPENLIALRHLGDIAKGQGDARTAQSWYQRVLDADPRNDEIAALVREMGAAVPLEGFAGIPADSAPEASAPVPESAEAETIEFAPPRLSDPFGELPTVAITPVEAVEPEPELDAATTAETPAFEPLVVPEARASIVLPASALPPERIVEPLPNTIEIPQVDAQRLFEAAQRPTPAVPFEPVPEPEAIAPVEPLAPAEPAAEDEPLEMPSAEELRHPPELVPPADPLADLPMEMLEGFGEASAESLLGSGRSAPAPESPLANLEAAIGNVEEPAPLISGTTGAHDSGLEFMDNPLSDLAAMTPTPSPTASALDALSEFGDANALAPELPLPPPVAPSFEPVDSDDLAAAPRVSAPVARISEPVARISEPVTRIPTPVGSPTFVTEAMGEVLEQQGLHAQAAEVYRTLLADRPGDAHLAARLAAAEAQLAPASWTAREWLQQLAAVRLPTPRSTTPVAVEAVATTVSVDVTSVEVSVVEAPVDPVAAPSGEAGASSLEALFGPPTNPADEAAALALAGLYDETAAIPGAPTAPASDELSLKTVFEPPAAPAPRTSAAFSFDQFFAAAPKAPTPAPGGGDAELAEFTRWLDGLKKQ